MYITFYVKQKEKYKEQKTTNNDLLNKLFNKESFIEDYSIPTSKINIPKLILKTVKIDELSENAKLKKPLVDALAILIKNKYNETKDLENKYNIFFIPKKTGGNRKITAPRSELKEALKVINTYITESLKVLPHNAAYAYTKNRGILEALQAHQRHKSRWFYKIDLKNFFPSITKELLIKQLKQIYPLNFLPWTDEEFIKALDIFFLNNGLPQGSPISPLLSNLVMLPIDYELENIGREIKDRITYTRYADDLLFSTNKLNNINTMLKELIKEIITSNGLTINPDKERIGSNSGRNWNLGLMYNKDFNITIGHKKKKEFNALLNNFILDKEQQTPEQKYYIQGLISYYSHIEPKFINSTIEKYNKKYNTNIKKTLK